MKAEMTKILLIEDNPADALMLRETLAEARTNDFEIVNADSLAKGLKLLSEKTFDVVLLDLNLPDSRGLATLANVYTHAPDVAIVILSGLSDDRMAIEAVQAGAEDCLVKGQNPGPIVARTINHAIQRHRLQVALRSLSPVDDLGGFYSRRGFWPLARQHLVLARQGNRPLALLFVELDMNPPGKNGHVYIGVMDQRQAVARAAQCFRRSFRATDIMAHLGDNLFAVLMLDVTPALVNSVIARLQQAAREARDPMEQPIILNVGAALMDMQLSTLDALMAEADKNLIQTKKR
jgi:diguanylate cyclase (GGDEF)-like protein